jgi:hypothetical protein
MTGGKLQTRRLSLVGSPLRNFASSFAHLADSALLEVHRKESKEPAKNRKVNCTRSNCDWLSPHALMRDELMMYNSGEPQ